MKHNGRRRKNAAQKPLLACCKGAMLACVLTVVFVLLFSLLLKVRWMQEDSIAAANTLIKGICALIAGWITARRLQNRAWLWAGASGGLYILVSFAAFSIAQSTFSLKPTLLADAALGFVCGVAAAIVQNIFRKRENSQA